MDIQESGAPLVAEGAPGDIQERAHCSATDLPRDKKLDPATKRAAMVRAFLEVGPDGLNCFQAALRYGDFVLRTTVSELRRYHGIEFTKRFETVPGRNGSKIDCVRYALTDEGAKVGRSLVEAA